MRSFIVTGASACGKTTLINEAMKHRYIHLPTHTTRGQRPGEIQEVHNAFLNRSRFEENFRNGIYFAFGNFNQDRRALIKKFCDHRIKEDTCRN